MMSGFKEMVSQDRDVLLNPNELGETHDIEGIEVVCVIDDTVLDEGKGAEFAISRSSKILFAKCEDMPPRRGYGAQLMVDGIPYLVQTWDEAMGMASISLEIAFNA